MRQIIRIGCAIALLAARPAAAETAIERAVRSPARTPALVARDGARHPAAELAFFGVTPTATVVEIWPGSGYWTQILAPLLHDRGRYYAAMGPSDDTLEESHFALTPDFTRMLAARPALYGRVHITTFGLHHPELAPAGSADLVLTFRNLHNFLTDNDAPQMLAAIRAALKPGGILGIEDHRGNTTAPQDPKAADGYMRQAYAIGLVERAGFTLLASSEIDANPRDTANWPQGVWTLPPILALGQQDRAKYQAIGEADNFVLKFQKPLSPSP